MNEDGEGSEREEMEERETSFEYLSVLLKPDCSSGHPQETVLFCCSFSRSELYTYFFYSIHCSPLDEKGKALTE